MNPPFHISDDAYAFLEGLPHVDGKEPGFTWSPSYRVSRGSEILKSYEGDHYAFVQASPEDWRTGRSAHRLLINNRGYWITLDLLENLTGKTLEVIEAMVGHGEATGKSRKFLVASTLRIETARNQQAEQREDGKASPAIS